MSKKIAKVDSASLIKDVNAGILSKQELVDKYQYSGLQSLSASIYWFRKKGLLINSKIRTVNKLTDDQKAELLKDHNAGYSYPMLLKKYNFKSLSPIYRMVDRLKKGEEKKSIKPAKVVTSVVPVSKPKVVTSSIRTINFPDGFKIQIEKSFVSGVLIHENGNITIVK